MESILDRRIRILSQTAISKLSITYIERVSLLSSSEGRASLVLPDTGKCSPSEHQRIAHLVCDTLAFSLEVENRRILLDLP
jgi:hypothetical protein